MMKKEEHKIEHKLNELLEMSLLLYRKVEQMSKETDALTAAVADNTTEVAAAVAAFGAGVTPTEDTQAVVDATTQIQANNDALKAATPTV